MAYAPSLSSSFIWTSLAGFIALLLLMGVPTAVFIIQLRDDMRDAQDAHSLLTEDVESLVAATSELSDQINILEDEITSEAGLNNRIEVLNGSFDALKQSIEEPSGDPSLTPAMEPGDSDPFASGFDEERP
jgi:hypothetical protein